MNFTYSGGTAQQRQWVLDAIAQCSYPLADLSVNVLVTWAAVLPPSTEITGHAHSYMTTQPTGPSAFTITIDARADDGTNPENAGLPNEAADIYDFYKQSFVHELGHVTHFTQIATDAQREQAAAQFWTTQISGSRQYGTLATWSELVWAHNMMEAVAETFKICFYTGRLIYGNRTIWKLDDGVPFSALMTLVMPAGGSAFYDDFSVDHPEYVFSSSPSAPVVGGGVMTIPANPVFDFSQGTILDEQIVTDTAGMMSLKVDELPPLDHFNAGDGWVLQLAAYKPDFSALIAFAQLTVLPLQSIHLELFTGDGSGYAFAVIEPTPPYWLVLRIDAVNASAEIWDTDPVLGGVPLDLVGPYPFGVTPFPAISVVSMNVIARGGTGAIVIDDWRWGEGHPVTPPPYPQLASGAIDSGAQQLGVLRARLNMSRAIQAKRIA